MKQLIYIIPTLLIGVLIGYLLFGRDSATRAHEHAMTNDTAATEQTWTCSMHPQIRQPEPGICPICEMDLIPLETNTSSDPLVLTMTEAAVKLADIQTTVVGATGSDVAGTLTLTGKVRPDERQTASVPAHVPGRIEKLMVTYVGERIRAGQVIARIYSPELVTAQRELLEAQKLVDLNPDLLAAAKQKLRNWRMSDTFVEKVLTSGQLVESVAIYAATGGTVTERRVSVGDYVGQGEALFVLTDYSRLWVYFDAYEADLAQIDVGDDITFTTPAVPGKVFRARIEYIDPVIDAARRTVGLRASVSNTGGQLKPEMLVTGRLQTEVATGEEALVVPQSAVLWTGPRSVVYVKVPDATVPSYAFREVTLGDRRGDNYVVLEGLTVGDAVVTHGAFVIDAAAQLNNQASMMNRDVVIAGQEPASEEVPPVPDYTAAATPALQEGLRRTVAAYLDLKDALVATDAAIAITKIPALLATVQAIDATDLAGDALAFWQQQERALSGHGEQMAQSDAIEEQREQFGSLSDALIRTVTAFGYTGEALYVQHCPMAFDNTGADWLASEEQINNPYFGDVMLRCGLVKEAWEQPSTE